MSDHIHVHLMLFQNTLLDHMEITIVEAEKRANGALNFKEFYTVYLIETKYVDAVLLNMYIYIYIYIYMYLHLYLLIFMLNIQM
jgi:hypothetical protein